MSVLEINFCSSRLILRKVDQAAHLDFDRKTIGAIRATGAPPSTSKHGWEDPGGLTKPDGRASKRMLMRTPLLRLPPVSVIGTLPVQGTYSIVACDSQTPRHVSAASLLKPKILP